MNAKYKWNSEEQRFSQPKEDFFETTATIFRPVELNKNTDLDFVLGTIEALENKGIKKGIYNPFNFELEHEEKNE